MFNRLISLLKDPSFVIMLTLSIVIIILLPMLVGWVIVSFLIHGFEWGLVYTLTLLVAVGVVGWGLFSHRSIIKKAWRDINDG